MHISIWKSRFFCRHVTPGAMRQHHCHDGGKRTRTLQLDRQVSITWYCHNMTWVCNQTIYVPQKIISDMHQLTKISCNNTHVSKAIATACNNAMYKHTEIAYVVVCKDSLYFAITGVLTESNQYREFHHSGWHFKTYGLSASCSIYYPSQPSHIREPLPEQWVNSPVTYLSVRTTFQKAAIRQTI